MRIQAMLLVLLTAEAGLAMAAQPPSNLTPSNSGSPRLRNSISVSQQAPIRLQQPIVTTPQVVQAAPIQLYRQVPVIAQTTPAPLNLQAPVIAQAVPVPQNLHEPSVTQVLPLNLQAPVIAQVVPNPQNLQAPGIVQINPVPQNPQVFAVPRDPRQWNQSVFTAPYQTTPVPSSRNLLFTPQDAASVRVFHPLLTPNTSYRVIPIKNRKR